MARRTRRKPRPARPVPLFEGLLSLLVLGVAFEWSQGSEPGTWYAAADDGSAGWTQPVAGGLRAGKAPAFRPDCWYLPVGDVAAAARPADDVMACSTAVAALWSESSVRPSAVRANADAYCALPPPARWVGVVESDSLSLPPDEGLAWNVLPDSPVRVHRMVAVPVSSVPVSRPPATSASLTGWSSKPRLPADTIASVGEAW